MTTIPDDDTTTANINVGGSFVSAIDFASDRDWVQVTLLQGVTYSIGLFGRGAAALGDPKLTIFNDNSVQVATDDDGGLGLNSLATYTPTVSGIYFLQAEAFGAGIGGYELTVEVEAPPNFLDSINWGSQLTDTSVQVYFARPGEVVDGFASRGWSAYEIQQTMLALQQISNVCDVSFTITNNAAAADFTLGTARSQQFLGFFNPPDTGANSGSGVMAVNGDGWDDFAGGGLEQGGFGFITLIHELGHGMGMAHPHDRGGSSTKWEGVTGPFDSYGTFDLNQGIYSVMSYNDGWETNPDGLPPDLLAGYEGTMMAFDIAMLQQIYGANTNFNGGADTYTLRDQNGSGTFYACIWDTGGIDKIVYAGRANANIDLRTAHLGYAEGAGGYISFASGIFGGFTIANGVVIENAKGGFGDDTVTGNETRNLLSGGAGDDALIGGLGRDKLVGGAGADLFAFVTLDDSGVTQQRRDTIADFRTGIDQIDLSELDGRSGGGANDAFVWVNGAAFSNTEGELRWQASSAGVVVQADRDGDGVADFTLLLAGINSVVQADFTL